MTEHKATLGQWNADRYDWARADTEALDGDPAFRCIMELRSRVEALEATQYSTQVNADISRRRWAAMSYRGVMLLPPIDCADPDLWIAERIYEMGFTDGKIATTDKTTAVTRDRAKDAAVPSHSLMELVADGIYINATGGVREEACAAIHAIADWLDQQELHVAATRLRQEVGG